jgi:hypothetical protein
LPVLLGHTINKNILQYIAIYCNILQYIAIYCSFIAEP